MKLFREQKVLEFDEKEVIVNEISPKELIKITSGAYSANEDMLVDCTNLNKDEINNLSIDAFNLIYNEFLKINKEHFETDTTDSKKSIDKKKS